MLHKFLRRYKHGVYRLCCHHSHSLGLPCYRAFRWDGYCSKHNVTCQDESDCLDQQRLRARWLRRLNLTA